MRLEQNEAEESDDIMKNEKDNSQNNESTVASNMESNKKGFSDGVQLSEVVKETEHSRSVQPFSKKRLTLM